MWIELWLLFIFVSKEKKTIIKNINIMKKKIFTLLVLLVAAVSSAWATDAVPAYNLSVEASKHGTGTVKFFVNSKEVTGADEGDMVTMTVTPDAGWIVDKAKVSAITYGNWEAAGARRNVQGDVPILGDVTLTAVETAENTWTFQMPAANVKVKGAYLKSSTLTFNPADKTNLIEVKVGDDKVNVKDSKTVKIEKVEGVIEGTPVKLTANTGYKFKTIEVKKKAMAPPPAKPEYADNAEELPANTKLYMRADLVYVGDWIWIPTYTAEQAQAVANYYAAITGTKCAVIYGHGAETDIYYVTSDNGVSGTVYRNDNLTDKFPGYKVYLLK